jgi:hypothetical protein
VIKLEEPKGGDIARAQNNDELFFLAFNANKRSLTLNLKTDEAKAHFRKIIAQSDVLIENFVPGALDRMGLGWKDLQQINPRLVYASVTGYGLDGPDAGRAGYDVGGFWARTGVAATLDLDPMRVFPVSAQKGLVAKVQNDSTLLDASSDRYAQATDANADLILGRLRAQHESGRDDQEPDMETRAHELPQWLALQTAQGPRQRSDHHQRVEYQQRAAESIPQAGMDRRAPPPQRG